MSDVLVPDVRAEPWSHGATVIVDVMSVAHWLQKDVRRRLAALHRSEGLDDPPPGTPIGSMTRGLHRIVDVLAHHGVGTRRLLLGTTLGAYPPDSTGWRPAGDDRDAVWRRNEAIEHGRRVVQHVTRALAGRDITVEGLPGLFGAGGESCVDELCVLAAAHASWTGEGEDVIVLSRDADVTIAPALAGAGRILIARSMSAQEAKAFARRGRRHGDDPQATAGPPAHLRLLPSAMRNLLLADDLDDGLLRCVLERMDTDEVPEVELATVDDAQVLRNSRDRKQVLSSALDVDHARAWLRRRGPLVDLKVNSTVVADPFGLLATANRGGVPGRVPTASSVVEALAPLELPQPIGQLAVVPDLVDSDHGLIALADEIGGLEIVPAMRDVLTRRIRRSLVALDDELEATIDSYDEDELPETIATASQFARVELTRIGSTASALEEKETAVLLAADLLWALVHTDGPVILMTDRPDLVTLLDLMDDHFGPALRMRERVTRVGLHADPFTGDGIAVTRSGDPSRWRTVLLTGRMLVDLLRLEPHIESTVDGTEPIGVREAIAYDAAAGTFAVLDLDGRSIGEVGLDDIVQFPVSDVELLQDRGAAAAAQLRAALARDLALHLDLRTPLPRPRLMRATDQRGVLPASLLSARVIAHQESGVRVRVTSSARTNEVLDAPTADLAATPTIGDDVEIIVTDDGEHCHVRIPDLASIADHVGRPRPALLQADDRATLLEPLRPPDRRDDAGVSVRVRPLLGPFPRPEPGELVLVTTVDEGEVQVVSTPLPWLAERSG
jgi:hypothetical protein